MELHIITIVSGDIIINKILCTSYGIHVISAQYKTPHLKVWLPVTVVK